MERAADVRLTRDSNPIADTYRRQRPDLTLPWRQTRFVAVDLETTGLDLRRDEIVSYGAVPIDRGRVQAAGSRYSLVGNTKRLTAASMRIHALRARDLEAAPPWEEAVDDLLAAITGRVLIAHAAWIETAMLGRAFKIRRVSAPTDVIDTAALARAAGLARADSRREPSLEGLTRELGLPTHTAHNALGDALMTAQLFLVLAPRLVGVGAPAFDLVSISRSHALR